MVKYQEVAMDHVTRENLPLPVVYYPPHYGTFFGFAKDQHSEVVMCTCSSLAVENLFRFLMDVIPLWMRTPKLQ